MHIGALVKFTLLRYAVSVLAVIFSGIYYVLSYSKYLYL